MTTTIVLARHGETVWHADNRYAGRSDVQLTDRGRQQAEALASWAAGASLDGIASSTLSRAVETAAPSSTITGRPLHSDERLVEVDFGDGDGRTRAEMLEEFPADLEAFEARPARHPLPGGEPGMAAIARANPAIDELVERHEGGRVLVVMHSTLLRLIIADRIGLDPDEYRRVFPAVGNCALNTLRIGPRGAALFGFNVPI